MPQVRQLFANLLRDEPATPKELAEKVTRVLRRNEEARIYHYLKQTKQFPQRRGRANGQADAPTKQPKA